MPCDLYVHFRRTFPVGWGLIGNPSRSGGFAKVDGPRILAQGISLCAPYAIGGTPQQGILGAIGRSLAGHGETERKPRDVPEMNKQNGSHGKHRTAEAKLVMTDNGNIVDLTERKASLADLRSNGSHQNGSHPSRKGRKPGRFGRLFRFAAVGVSGLLV